MELTTASGPVETNEECDVYVNEIDITLTAFILDDSPSLISLGLLCRENGFAFMIAGQLNPIIWTENFQVECNVPIITPATVRKPRSEQIYQVVKAVAARSSNGETIVSTQSSGTTYTYRLHLVKKMINPSGKSLQIKLISIVSKSK